MRIVHAALEAVVAHAREARPGECCGLLLGADGVVTETRRTRNIAESPTRFVIDPSDHIAGRRDARARGLEVLGFYHSHPHSPARPSPTDLAESYWDAVHLIVSLASDSVESRLFRIEQGAAIELRLEID